MSDTVCAIKVEGVSKSYPTGFWRKRVQVLTRLAFEVRENEIVGFLGPNGAGKTTTIKILNRLAFPDRGTVTVLGEAAGSRSEVRRRIGFMPEQPYFYEYLSAEEFLRLCGQLYGMRRPAIVERTAALLARVGLEDAGRTAIRKYSKGMMQRLGLAQALLHNPDLVILDEPMSGLDPMGRMEIRNLIRELKSSGKTVFFSSHIISDVEALCDRVIMLQKGRIVSEGTVDELVGKEVSYVELVLSPPPSPDWLSRAPHPLNGGSVQGNLFIVKARDCEEANEWIDMARAAGTRVYSLVPVKRRLEEIYVEQISGDGLRQDGHAP